MLTNSGVHSDFLPVLRGQRITSIIMSLSALRHGAAALTAAGLIFAAHPALSQSGEQKPAEPAQPQKPQAPSSEPAKDGQKKLDEFAEAAQQLSGPAGQPECVWLGRRVVTLMWRDDLDTAFRHLDLYDRFGCPGGHVQATFRCLVQQGNLDPKAPESLGGRVHACWINPALQPPAPTAAAPAGTTNR
jgi:hypothetical protein